MPATANRVASYTNRRQSAHLRANPKALVKTGDKERIRSINGVQESEAAIGLEVTDRPVRPYRGSHQVRGLARPASLRTLTRLRSPRMDDLPRQLSADKGRTKGHPDLCIPPDARVPTATKNPCHAPPSFYNRSTTFIPPLHFPAPRHFTALPA